MVLRSERRIAMRKERLFVSLRRIRVEYEFVNESQDDVTTEVVFPISELAPEDYEQYTGTDFTVSIDGSRIPVEKEVRAFFEGKEVTRALRAAGLNRAAVENFVPKRELTVYFFSLPTAVDGAARGAR